MIGTTLSGRFTLDKELGRGGMGAVYRATDTVLQRQVAIKVLKEIRGEEVGHKIRLEAQILARLLHDNIVRLYDLNMEGEAYYFIMEEVDGASFHRRGKLLSLNEKVRILAQVSEALDYAHHQGVIHRDVKPGNVLLTSADQAKLSDFGLSVLSGQTQESGVARGTPSHMSPEQARGRRLDHRTDLYAVGVMLYECATGSLPFSGNVAAVMAQQVNTPPDPPRSRKPEITPALDEFILALLAKSPEDRPSSGREVAEHLLRLLSSGQLIDSEATLEAPADGGDPTTVATGLPPSRSAPSTEFALGSASKDDRLVPRGAPGLTSVSSSTGQVSGPSPSPSILNAFLSAIEADPIALSPDERYLAGHYLGYLIGGCRRRGFFLRRPLDPLNADRARLMVAMTGLCLPGDHGLSLDMAVELLEKRLDLRPSLNPVVVLKYLLGRDTPAKRKRFRQVRSQVQKASPYASEHMTDEQGILNPGLMPQVLEDLRRIAPVRTEVDDELVHRWNEIAEVWRSRPEFRESVLRYATKGAWKDPASARLWPEVVYPLIERARRQRQLRSRTEVLWDALGAPLLHVGDAGLRMDRMMVRSVPKPVIEKLDVALANLIDEPMIEEQAVEASAALSVNVDPSRFDDLDLGAPEADPNVVRLGSPDPVRLTLGDLRALWRDAIAALRSGPQGGKGSHKHVAVGPYRVTVVATIRARSAGQVAIQGMTNKQIELLVPSFTGGGSNSRPVLAAWHYRNNALVVTYVDHTGNARYILWNAELNQQTNFDDPADLNHALLGLCLESPPALSDVLSKRYRPPNPV